MADITTSNLYPPIIESFMPAFVADGDDVSCTIKFEIPDTNNINEINIELYLFIIIKYISQPRFWRNTQEAEGAGLESS